MQDEKESYDDEYYDEEIESERLKDWATAK